MHTFLCSITISIDRCCSVMDLRSGRAFAWVNKDQISLLCIFKADAPWPFAPKGWHSTGLRNHICVCVHPDVVHPDVINS